MVFADGWRRSTQSEREIRRQRQRSSSWTIEEDRLLLLGGNFLNWGTWAATLAINVRHVIADREDTSRMSPENGGFSSAIDITDGSGTGDVSHTGSVPLVRPGNLDGLGGGLRDIDRLLATFGEFSRGTSKLWRRQRLESWLRFGV